MDSFIDRYPNQSANLSGSGIVDRLFEEIDLLLTVENQFLINKAYELVKSIPYYKNESIFDADFGPTSDFGPPIFRLRPLNITFLIIAAMEFVFGSIANLTIIIRVWRQGVLRARIRMLLMCLSVANLIHIVLEFPVNQFAWSIHRTWPGPDWSCKLFAMLRMFAAYLISFVLVAISLDRCFNSIRASSPQQAWSRMIKLLSSSLVGAVICSVPQALVFENREIPFYKGYKQCVSVYLFNGETSFRVIYPLFCILCLYLVPLVILMMAYCIILYLLTKPIGRNDPYQLVLYPPSRQSSNSVQHQYIRKARQKTLKVLILTCGSFFVLWTPYIVNRLFLLSLSNRADFAQYVPGWLDKGCELLALSNVVVSPMVYGLSQAPVWKPMFFYFCYVMLWTAGLN